MRVAMAIEKKLNEALSPQSLKITDQSDQHVGHAGARPEGESHFHVEVVSAAFEGKSRIECQRLVYQVLAEEMADGIHALSLLTAAPGEKGGN